jgi:hypothetical protein
MKCECMYESVIEKFFVKYCFLIYSRFSPSLPQAAKRLRNIQIHILQNEASLRRLPFASRLIWLCSEALLLRQGLSGLLRHRYMQEQKSRRH